MFGFPQQTLQLFIKILITLKKRSSLSFKNVIRRMKNLAFLNKRSSFSSIVTAAVTNIGNIEETL
jgi:hypothetical protein